MRSLIRAHADTTEGARHVSVGREYALSQGWTVLEDESAYTRDGQVRAEATCVGRPVKPRTTVDESAAKKPRKTPSPTPPAEEIS